MVAPNSYICTVNRSLTSIKRLQFFCQQVCQQTFVELHKKLLNKRKRACYSDPSRITNGVIDLTAWSFFNANEEKKIEILQRLKKEFKNQQNEIWKPLRKGTSEWQNAFENILLIRTFSIISILYNDKKVTEPPYKKLVEIIETINELESAYKPMLFDSYVTQFSNEIMEKYLTSY